MNIAGVRCDNVTFRRAIHLSVLVLKNLARASVFYLNLDCLNKARKDGTYREILDSAFLVLPDGIGLKLAASITGHQVNEKQNVTDFFPSLMRELAKLKEKIFLIGGEEGVADRAARNLKQQIPGIEIVGSHSGFFANDEQVIGKINNSQATVLFVGMGAPLQEKWIAKNRDQLKPLLCLGVGALFNWLSGHQKRAPRFLRNLHLEWLWRVALEPKRLSRRYLVEGVGLLFLLLSFKMIRGEVGSL